MSNLSIIDGNNHLPVWDPMQDPLLDGEVNFPTTPNDSSRATKFSALNDLAIEQINKDVPRQISYPNLKRPITVGIAVFGTLAIITTVVALFALSGGIPNLHELVSFSTQVLPCIVGGALVPGVLAGMIVRHRELNEYPKRMDANYHVWASNHGAV